MTGDLPRRAIAEALGTGLLLAAVVGSGIMAQRLAGGNVAIALLCNTIATGAALTVLILIFGPLSGAHFNPVVSAAFAIRRDLAWPDAALYITAQVGGGIVGVWAAHLMFDLAPFQLSQTGEARRAEHDRGRSPQYWAGVRPGKTGQAAR